MTRSTDDDNHEKECFSKHHEHDKRISAVESQLKIIENTHCDTVEEIKLKLEKSDARFERAFSEFTNAVQGLRIDLEKFMSATNAKSSYIQANFPIFVAIASAAWALYLQMHK